MNTMNPTKLDSLKVYNPHLPCQAKANVCVKGPYSTVGYHILYLRLQSGQITISCRDKNYGKKLPGCLSSSRFYLSCERQKSWTVTAVTCKLSQKSHAYTLQRLPTLIDLGLLWLRVLLEWRIVRRKSDTVKCIKPIVKNSTVLHMLQAPFNDRLNARLCNLWDSANPWVGQLEPKKQAALKNGSWIINPIVGVYIPIIRIPY